VFNNRLLIEPLDYRLRQSHPLFDVIRCYVYMRHNRPTQARTGSEVFASAVRLTSKLSISLFRSTKLSILFASSDTIVSTDEKLIIYIGLTFDRQLMTPKRQCSYMLDLIQSAFPNSVFGRPSVKRFSLCYRTVVCPVLSGCL